MSIWRKGNLRWEIKKWFGFLVFLSPGVIVSWPAGVSLAHLVGLWGRERGYWEMFAMCTEFLHMCFCTFSGRMPIVFIIFSKEVCDLKGWVLLGLGPWRFRLFWWKLNWHSDTLAWIQGPILLPQLKIWALCCLCCLKAIWTKHPIARIRVRRHKVWRAKFLIAFDPVLHIMNFYLLMNLSLLLLKVADNQT